MTSVLKTICVVITGLLLAVTTQVNGEEYYSSPYSGPDSCEAYCPTAYCGPDCNQSCYCGELNITGELLYWRPQLCGLQSAFGSTAISTNVAGHNSHHVTTTTVTETDEEPDFHWDTGFRVGANLVFNCFDVEADWTHFNGGAKYNKRDSDGRWRIKYDTIDLTFGRYFWAAPCFYFKPFIGVRGLRIRQTLESHLKTLFVSSSHGESTVITTMHDKETFWGVGPELGIEADWRLICDFGLYASFDVVTYYGEVNGKNFDVDTFPTSVNVCNGKKHHCFDSAATDAAIGIRWCKTWCRCGYGVNLMLKAGLEQHRIYDFSDLGADGTLSFDGATFGGGIGISF